MSKFRASPISLFILGLALVGGAVVLQPMLFPTAAQSLHRRLAHSITHRSTPPLAEAEDYLGSHPQDFAGIALAAEAAATVYEHQRSIELFQRLPADGGEWEFVREYGIGKRCEAIHRFSDAEEHYRAALRLNPLHIDSNMRIGHILLCSGRSWEAGPHFFQVMQQGRCNGDILLGMSYTDRFFRRDERMEQAGMAQNPPEPLMQLSLARRAINQNQTETAQQLLSDAVKARPDLAEAQGRLGRILSDQGNHSQFEAWRLALPQQALEHPEVLFSLGLQASRLGLYEGAARCFLEALNRSPSHLASTIQLASCLERMGNSKSAKQFSDRGRTLAQLEANLNVIRSDLLEKNLQDMVKEQHQLGRHWEAAGWCYVMRWIYVDQVFPTTMFGIVRDLAIHDQKETASTHRPDLELPVEKFRWPEWPTASSVMPQMTVQENSAAWQLEEISQSVGVNFEYVEGTTEKTRLNHIFSTVGGGLAGFDYDRDGWCDLYLPQGNDWRNPSEQPEFYDRLYRNTGHHSFVQTTAAAGIRELGFSHGVAVGDVDQDGFHDIYVCNKGRNRFYRNLGDGTFEDVTELSGVNGDQEDWSTSAVFADLNGDSVPDLYVLNYSPVTPTTEKTCHRDNGQDVACTPGELPSCADRLFVNQGDGTFRDVTAESQLTDSNGRGLGVVVWKYGSDHKLGIFVSNDTTANYLFVNQGNSPAGVPQFQEEGVVRGVAFDLDGNAQASMGVAAADANGDGELELFVTNFFNESNTYYSRGADGFFSDITRPANLRDASFKMLGFGCQFADLNCDGWPDLIATNGHVDQQSSDGTMDRMPPQVFWNQAGKSYQEVPAQSLGEFFHGKYLGRGMAVADWNRDGRADIGISHLHGRLALLSHAGSALSNFTTEPLTIRLVGRKGSREAIGATIRVQEEEWSSTSLQTGGSGYLVSNEPVHQFHIPRGRKSVQVTVSWPDGSEQHWEQIEVGGEWMLVEGQATAWNLRKYGEY